MDRIIDFHTHIFPPSIAEKAVKNIGDYYNIPMDCSGTLEELISNMESFGIEKSIVLPTATNPDQVTKANDWIASVATERIIAFGTVYPGMDNIGEEIERIISLGLKGLKLHPEFQNFAINDRKMDEIYDAVQGRLPVMMHMGDINSDNSSPHRLADVVKRFPNLKIIAAHLGGYTKWDEAIEYLSGRENIVFDSSSSLWILDSDRALEIIRKLGVDNVLFGTDYPMTSIKNELEYFNRLNLTDKEREKILYTNGSEFIRNFFI